jgi:hypothetical protein
VLGKEVEAADDDDDENDVDAKAFAKEDEFPAVKREASAKDEEPIILMLYVFVISMTTVDGMEWKGNSCSKRVGCWVFKTSTTSVWQERLNNSFSPKLNKIYFYNSYVVLRCRIHRSQNGNRVTMLVCGVSLCPNCRDGVLLMMSWSYPMENL